MISNKVIFIIVLFVSLLVGVSIYLIYNSQKDNFYNISPSVSGRYVKILAPLGQPINIAGVFIYDQNGNNLITNHATAIVNASMNSVYTPATNALDIIFADANGQNNVNVNRNINTSSPLTFENYTFTKNSQTFPLSQNWNDQINNISHSNGGENSQDYWQYDFGKDVDISAVEIYTRTDCCTERNTNINVQVIKNNGNISILNTPDQFAPIIIARVDNDNIDSNSTTAGATSTTAGATSTTAGATSTTAGATSTTAGDTSTTASATSTTAGDTSTTAGATSTTAGATSTTAGTTYTTAGATSTIAGATSTIAGATSTTAGATSITTIDNRTMLGALNNVNLDISSGTNSNMSMPSMHDIPVATPGMISNLLDNGIGIDYLTSQGIGLNNAFRGPSTNIVQTNFSGTSNVYSPFLYYNKGSSEKFMGKLYHPYP